MDKKTMGLVGAVAALVPGVTAAAPVSSAAAYADLVRPIPNALSQLAAADEIAAAREAQNEGPVQLAQWHHHHHRWYRHHHHHHHHRWWRRYYHHHHHHHYW